MSGIIEMDFDAAGRVAIPELLARRAEETPQKDALRTVRGAVSYAAWAGRAAAISKLLRESRPDLSGERVALWMSNDEVLLFATAFMGIVDAGAIAVPLDDRMAPAAAVQVIVRARPCALIMANDVASNLGADGLASLMLDHEVRDAQDVMYLHWLGSGRPREATVISHAGLEPTALTRAAGPDDDACIAFTSGSTGAPKGAVLTHSGLVSYAERAAHFIFARPRGAESTTDLDVLQSPIPVYTAANIIENLVPAIFGGYTSVYEDRRFDPVASERRMREHRTTIYNGAPAHYAMMCEQPRPEPGTSHVELMVAGGSRFAPALYERMRARWPQAAIANWYGSNESGPAQTLNYGATIAGDPGSIGLPVPPTEARIVLGDGRRLPSGEVGELWLRAPGMMRGYFGDPEQTAATIQHGWLRTGDLARIESDGRINLLGRNGDRINRGGFKFYPSEIESVLDRHTAVRQVAVIGVEHSILGEDVVAFVVPQPDATIDVADLRRFCQAQLARNKVPSRVVVIEELPRNRYEKVNTRELRRLWAAQLETEATIPKQEKA